MKKQVFFWLLMGLMCIAASAMAATDPVLEDVPSLPVVQCSENVRIAIYGEINHTTTLNLNTSDTGFLCLPVSLLFQEAISWSGLNPESFILYYTGKDGTEYRIAPDVALTSIYSSQRGWGSFSEKILDPAYFRLYLVFRLPTFFGTNWRLEFQPMSRENFQALCYVNIPLDVK